MTNDVDPAKIRFEIRESFVSIARFSRMLGVSRESVYKAINGHPYMKKLRQRIIAILYGGSDVCE